MKQKAKKKGSEKFDLDIDLDIDTSIGQQKIFNSSSFSNTIQI